MLTLLSAFFLLIAFTACSSTEDSIKDTTKPEVPANNNDGQTDSSKGGDIKKDDFTMTFPSGTFKADTKISVTKIGKGQTCGGNEVSDFYQITAPVTTYKPITFKIKSENLGDDACLVLHTYGYIKSDNELVMTNDIMETTYSNGEYTATLPTLTNGNDTATISYSVGLVKAAFSSAGTRAPKGGFAVAEGMVKDIGWKLYIDPATDKVSGSWMVINNEYHNRIGSYIEESIQKILDLGFTLKTWGKPLRTIRFYYISDPDKYGYFKQSPIDDAFSYLGIGVEKLIESKDDPSQLKSTLIHELFHLFQADYDPREAYVKAGGFSKPNSVKDLVKWKLEPTTIDNESIIHEMASIWVEQFMNNGNLNAGYLSSDAFANVFLHEEKLGFGQERKRWNNGIESFQDQGYTMGPWLYYLVNKIKDYGMKRKDHPVLELFELFRKKWKSGSYNSYYILEEWINSYDPLFLSATMIDDYYLQLWEGELVKDFNISKLVISNKNAFENKTDKFERKYGEGKSQIYPFGCGVTRVTLNDFKNVKLDDKELVIKQENPDVHTYVILTDKSSKFSKYKYVRRNGELFAVEKNDSIVLKGNTLESLRLQDGTFGHYFFLVTTNLDSKMHSTTVNPSRVTIELRDINKVSVEPDELEFSADGGTKDVKVNCGPYKHFGYKIEEKDQSWISAEKVDNNGAYVRFKVKPNTAAVKRETTVYCYVANADNATDDQKMFLPVKISQKSNCPIVGVSLKVGFYYIMKWENAETEEYLGKLWKDWSNDIDNTQIVVKGTHVTCSRDNDVLSFDIDDLGKLKSGKATISNINGNGNGWGIAAKGTSKNSYDDNGNTITCGWDLGEVSNGYSSTIPVVKDSYCIGDITITLSK